MQYYICFRSIIQLFSMYISYDVIITISLIPICHHAKLLPYYWLYSLCRTLDPVVCLFSKWKFVPLIALQLFHPWNISSLKITISVQVPIIPSFFSLLYMTFARKLGRLHAQQLSVRSCWDYFILQLPESLPDHWDLSAQS